MKGLEELERLAKGATFGPTAPRYVPSEMPVSCVPYGVISTTSLLETCRVWEREDALFYAAASPDVILSLIRELKIAKKIIDNEAKKRVLPDLWKKSMYEDATREIYPETEQP
jgi:hypothetical protein